MMIYFAQTDGNTCRYLVTQLQVMIARGLGFVGFGWQKYLKGVAQKQHH